jgi:hypothetical protein
MPQRQVLIRPIAEVHARAYARSMRPDDPPRDPRLGELLWNVQPRWVKLLASFMMLPAWGLMAVCMFRGTTDQTPFKVALSLFVAVGVVELACIARAFWRTDI